MWRESRDYARAMAEKYRYDHTDTARFAELFPALHRRGLRARYQLIGVDLPQPLLWGYWARHLADIRFDPSPNSLYQRRRALVGDRDYFVMTSNVDALFERNGFDPDRIWTPQGDYGRYQCDTPCCRQTWARLWRRSCDVRTARVAGTVLCGL